MATSKQERDGLRARLEEVLGREHATTLMTQLAVPWEELATKADLRGLGEQLRAEIAGTRQDLQGELKAVRHEVEAQGERLGAEIEAGKREMHLGLEATEHRILATLHRELNVQMRTTVFALVATASVVVAAVRL